MKITPAALYVNKEKPHHEESMNLKEFKDRGPPFREDRSAESRKIKCLTFPLSCRMKLEYTTVNTIKACLCNMSKGDCLCHIQEEQWL